MLWSFCVVPGKWDSSKDTKHKMSASENQTLRSCRSLNPNVLLGCQKWRKMTAMLYTKAATTVKRFPSIQRLLLWTQTTPHYTQTGKSQMHILKFLAMFSSFAHIKHCLVFFRAACYMMVHDTANALLDSQVDEGRSRNVSTMLIWYSRCSLLL